MSTVHLDFEVRSKVDLKVCGAARYAIDPSTEILMCGVSAEGSDRVYLWINPKFATADFPGENEEAEEMIAKATLLKAHNAPFEQSVTWGASERRAASPFKREPDINIWRCSAAVARKAGLPWSLDKLGEALNLPTQKDARGKALIRFFCIPTKEGTFNEPRDHPEKWAEFCSYCVTDVVSEKQADHKLKPFELKGFVLESFLFDLRMNHRGIPVNVPALKNAQKIIDQVQSEVGKEFVALTGLNPTQREKVRALVDLPDMQAETVQEAISHAERAATLGIDGLARLEVLRLYQLLSFAAIKKVQTMLDVACPDGHARGCHLWYGAGTGRWSGKLIQPQNFKKTDLEFKDSTRAIYAAVCKGWGPDALRAVYGEPIESIANSIRHFIHDPSCEMLDADYNAVEGRIACWIAGQNDILEDWRLGKDLYKRAAAFVFKVDESSIGKGAQRDFGKVVELACQFGLGEDGFMRTCANWGIPCDADLAKRAVREYYRPTHKMIVQRWWNFNDWMRNAIAEPGTRHGPFTVRTISGIKYLLLQLPSGRSLAYPHIEANKREPTALERIEMKKGKNYPPTRFIEITYWGQFQGATWGRVRLHGAMAFENEVQAIAADLMSHGGLTAEKREMPPFMLVHDQALSKRVAGKTPEEYAAALADLPPWAAGLPLKCESKLAPYYSK